MEQIASRRLVRGSLITLFVAGLLAGCGEDNGNNANPPAQSGTNSPTSQNDSPNAGGEQQATLIANNVRFTQNLSDHELAAAGCIQFVQEKDAKKLYFSTVEECPQRAGQVLKKEDVVFALPANPVKDDENRFEIVKENVPVGVMLKVTDKEYTRYDIAHLCQASDNDVNTEKEFAKICEVKRFTEGDKDGKFKELVLLPQGQQLMQDMQAQLDAQNYRAALDKLQQKLKEASDLAKQTEKQIDQLQAKVDERKKETKTLTEERDKLKKENADLQKKLSEEQMQTTTLQTELKDLKTKRDKLEKKITDLQNRLKAAQKSETDLKAQVDELSKKLESANTEAQKLETQIEELRKKAENATENKEELQKQIAELEEKRKEAEASRTEVTTMLQNLRERLKNAQSEVKQLQTDLNDLSEALPAPQPQDQPMDEPMDPEVKERKEPAEPTEKEAASDEDSADKVPTADENPSVKEVEPEQP